MSRKQAIARARFGREPLFKPHELDRPRPTTAADLEWAERERRIDECLARADRHNRECAQAMNDLHETVDEFSRFVARVNGEKS